MAPRGTFLPSIQSTTISRGEASLVSCFVESRGDTILLSYTRLASDPGCMTNWSGVKGIARILRVGNRFVGRDRTTNEGQTGKDVGYVGRVRPTTDPNCTLASCLACLCQ